jgi:hypothetical protein
MTVKEVFYDMIKENWGEDFRRCFIKTFEVCSVMPYAAFQSADNFISHFRKLTDNEQLSVIEKMLNVDSYFGGLYKFHKRKLFFITKGNYNKHIKFLVKVRLKWVEPEIEDYFSEEVFVSDYRVSSVENKTVQNVINAAWKSCNGYREDSPPQAYGDRYGFVYDGQCFCFITVTSEPLLICE